MTLLTLSTYPPPSGSLLAYGNRPVPRGFREGRRRPRLSGYESRPPGPPPPGPPAPPHLLLCGSASSLGRRNIFTSGPRVYELTRPLASCFVPDLNYHCFSVTESFQSHSNDTPTSSHFGSQSPGAETGHPRRWPATATGTDKVTVTERDPKAEPSHLSRLLTL